MRRTLLLAAVAMASSVSAAAGRPLPADAARLASRLDACLHFAGELNGDRSARDREVTRRMVALRCERIPQEAAAMRRRYPRDPAVQRAMQAAADL